MAYTDDTALLATVNSAIEAIVSGRVQEYRIGARTVTYVDLKELRATRDDLERRITNTASGGGIAHATFRRGL